MPAQFNRGITFSPTENVTFDELHTLVDNGSLRPGAISEQTLQSPALTSSDCFLFLDSSIPALTKLELAKLWAEPMAIGGTVQTNANFSLVSAPVAQFTSASIASLTGSAQSIAKAWVNFNGALATNGNPQTTSSTSFVGTTITANFAAAHGLAQGDSISIFAQTGNSTVLNGTWTVASVPASTSITFVVTSTPPGTLATAVPIHKIPIRASYNVSSVGVSTSGGTTAGSFIVNFAAGTFADANYCAVVSGCQGDSATSTFSVGLETSGGTPSGAMTLYTASQCQILSQSSTGTNQAMTTINFVAFR